MPFYRRHIRIKNISLSRAFEIWPDKRGGLWGGEWPDKIGGLGRGSGLIRGTGLTSLLPQERLLLL